MEYGPRPGSERLLRVSGRAMAGILMAFVALNAVSAWYEGKVEADPALLEAGADMRAAARRTAENAVLLQQRARWLEEQAVVGAGAAQAHVTVGEAPGR